MGFFERGRERAQLTHPGPGVEADQPVAPESQAARALAGEGDGVGRADARARVKDLAGRDKDGAAVAVAVAHPVEDDLRADCDHARADPVAQAGQLGGAPGEPARHPGQVSALALGDKLAQDLVLDARGVRAGQGAEPPQEKGRGRARAGDARRLDLHHGRLR